MKTEHKLLLRNISSYAMIITALLIVFWFLFVIVTSALNFNVYSGDSIELMVFILFMALVVIGIAAVINISLSIDLIAEARIQELKLNRFSTTKQKMILIWATLIPISFFVISILLLYYQQSQEIKEFKTHSTEIIETHKPYLEEIFTFLEDSSKLINTKDVLEKTIKSSEFISSADLIFKSETNDNVTFALIERGTNDSLLVKNLRQELVTIFYSNEKKLLVKMISGKQKTPVVLEDNYNNLHFYYPFYKDDKAFIIRIDPVQQIKFSRRR